VFARSEFGQPLLFRARVPRLHQSTMGASPSRPASASASRLPTHLWCTRMSPTLSADGAGAATAAPGLSSASTSKAAALTSARPADRVRHALRGVLLPDLVPGGILMGGRGWNVVHAAAGKKKIGEGARARARARGRPEKNRPLTTPLTQRPAGSTSWPPPWTPWPPRTRRTRQMRQRRWRRRRRAAAGEAGRSRSTPLLHFRPRPPSPPSARAGRARPAGRRRRRQ
jgi:hypothetical protein